MLFTYCLNEQNHGVGLTIVGAHWKGNKQNQKK
jgi:hypothetical protein